MGIIVGKIFVEVRKFIAGLMDEPSMEIQSITKIKKTAQPKNKFVFPTEKEGFTRGAFMEVVRVFGEEKGNFFK